MKTNTAIALILTLVLYVGIITHVNKNETTNQSEKTAKEILQKQDSILNLLKKQENYFDEGYGDTTDYKPIVTNAKGELIFPKNKK